jgi:hypothetical protein
MRCPRDSVSAVAMCFAGAGRRLAGGTRTPSKPAVITSAAVGRSSLKTS